MGPYGSIWTHNGKERGRSQNCNLLEARKQITKSQSFVCFAKVTVQKEKKHPNYHHNTPQDLGLVLLAVETKLCLKTQDGRKVPCEQSGCCISFPVFQSEVSAPQSSGRTEEVHSPKRKKMRFSDLEEPETSTLRVKHLPLPDSSSSLDPCQHPGSQIVSRQEKGRAFSRESVPSKKQGLTKRTVGTPQPESNQ